MPSIDVPDPAKAFVDFLYSKTAQKNFAIKGYRPVRQDVFRQFNFRTPKKLFTIRSLGSWSKVDPKFFDPTNGIVTKIEQGLG